MPDFASFAFGNESCNLRYPGVLPDLSHSAVVSQSATNRAFCGSVAERNEPCKLRDSLEMPEDPAQCEISQNAMKCWKKSYLTGACQCAILSG